MPLVSPNQFERDCVAFVLFRQSFSTQYPTRKAFSLMTKSDAQESTEAEQVKKAKGRTLDSVATPASQTIKPKIDLNADENRFRLSGIDAEPYFDTRIRRWEFYQIAAVKQTLAALGVKSSDDFASIADDTEKMVKLTRVLGTCLVCPASRRGVATLFRGGEQGVAEMVSDLTARQVIGAMQVACELCEVFA